MAYRGARRIVVRSTYWLPSYASRASSLDRASCIYAKALHDDDSATLEELRESVEILEDTERTTRRMLGNTHPMTKGIELALQKSRDALRAREKPSPGSV